jgi:hypothetical protein
MHSILIFISFLINNIYFSNLNGIPISIFINLIILIFLLIIKIKITPSLSYDINVILLILIVVIFSLINSLFSGSIYYFYVISLNLVFLISLDLFIRFYKKKYLIYLVLIVLLINNLLTLGLLLNISAVATFVNWFNQMFDINTRITYRINGIVGGTLKAGIISLYFIENKLWKYLLATSSILLVVFQARTGVYLIVITLLFYFLYIINERKIKVDIKSTFITLIVITCLLLFGFKSIGYLSQNYKYFEGMLTWQSEGLFSGVKSHSIESLNQTSLNELTSKYANSSILEILLGNGETNWAGPESIHADNGFVVQLIGFGLIGSVIIWSFYIILFKTISKKVVKYNKNYIIIYLNLFICHILLNYKSTSLLGYNYFNLFFIILFSINIYLLDNEENKFGKYI